MKGININDKKYPFTEWILERLKTIETREKPTLNSLIGKRAGIIRTGCGKAMLVGYADITGVVEYNTVEEFRADYEKHMVQEGSAYDIKTKKYGYILENVERCEPVPVTAKGIVIRNI